MRTAMTLLAVSASLVFSACAPEGPAGHRVQIGRHGPRIASAEVLLAPKEAPFDSGEVVPAGRRIALELSEERTNWNHAKWVVCELPEPVDLSECDGIRLKVNTAEPRSDAGVYLALRETDGTWYSHGWACDLTEPSNTGVALFRDFTPAHWISPNTPHGKFFDENLKLDRDKVSAVAVGCVNPLGVGTVAFTLTEMEKVAVASEPSRKVTVDVTGEMLSVNGTETVPSGLFGGFHLPEGHHRKYRMGMDREIYHNALNVEAREGTEITPMLVNTAGDRVRPSPRLVYEDWEERSRKVGEAFGKAAAEADGPIHVEYYNEPYLNWANGNRANFNPRFYNFEEASEGGQVRIAHDGEPAPHLRWTRDFDKLPWAWCSEKDFRRGRDADGTQWSVYAVPYGHQDWLCELYRHEPGMPWFHRSSHSGNYEWSMKPAEGLNQRSTYEPKVHPPMEVEEGRTYTVTDSRGNEAELTAFTPWHVYDETQFTYWSGKGMVKMYLEPMLTFGRAAKAEDPNIVFIVGWGNRPSEDHWAGFRQLYKPVIDASADIANGVCDHDYGGDATKMSANYEFITAYGMMRHDRWLCGYNTECAVSADPQAYEGAEGGSADELKFSWVSAKILHALRYVPGKARSFAHFGYGGGWFSDEGEGVALKRMINLRGRLVNVKCSDPRVYAVASIDGTDPDNPRPEELPDRREMVVAIWNDRDVAREVEVSITAPQWASFADGAYVLDPDRRPLEVSAQSAAYSRRMPGQSLAVLTLPLEGDLPVGPQVIRRQAFSEEILAEVDGAEPVRARVRLDGDRSNIRRAWVRFVTERLGRGEGVLALNGKEYPLPAAVTPENSPWLREVEIDPADLKATNVLTFRTAEASDAGYLLACASIMVEMK